MRVSPNSLSQYLNIAADMVMFGKAMPAGCTVSGMGPNEQMTVQFKNGLIMTAGEFVEHRCKIDRQHANGVAGGAQAALCLVCHEQVNLTSPDWDWVIGGSGHDPSTWQMYDQMGNPIGAKPAKPLYHTDGSGPQSGEEYEVSITTEGGPAKYWWKGVRAEHSAYPPQFDSNKHRIIKEDFYIRPAAHQGPFYVPVNTNPAEVTYMQEVVCEMTWEDRWDDGHAPVPVLNPRWLTGKGFDGKIEPTDQEEDSLLQYVRHTVKPTKTPCAACGDNKLYWGHETLAGVKYTGKEDNFCIKCQVSGPQVLINEDATLHECVKETAAEVVPDQDGTPGGAETEAPEERPDLQGMQTEDDPWATGEVPAPMTPQGEGEDSQPAEPDSAQAPQGAPPWETDAAEGAGQPQESADGDGEPEIYVLRDEWMEARTQDGEHLLQKIDANERKAHAKFKLMLEKLRTQGERIANHEDRIKDQSRCIATQNIKLSRVDDRIKKLEQSGGIVPSVASDLPSTVTINIQRPDGAVYELPDLHHYQLPLVLKFSAARMHTLMVGTPAVGKSKMARQAAKALELPFYTLSGSLNPMTSKTDIVGYMNSVGEYVPTAFYEAFTKGGVMFLDEMDNAHPAALASINDAAAIDPGETCGFPNGMQERHPDFILIGAANTFGRGPSQAFSGRQRGDAATWDRFNIIETQIDDVLEMTLASRTGAPLRVVDEIVRFVRRCRKVAADKHLPFVITPRATVDMCKAYNQGISVEEMVEARIRRGTSDQDYGKLTEGMRMLALDDLVTQEA